MAGEPLDTLLYAELRRLAAYHFRHEDAGHTLQPTALVNEALLRLISAKDVEVNDRNHFFALAARQMRRILIDHARRRRALKRGSSQVFLSLDQNEPAAPSAPIEDVLTIDGVLRDLEQLDARAAQILELRIFGGLESAEIAGALHISIATVKRDWAFAKAWLVSRLRQTDSQSTA